MSTKQNRKHYYNFSAHVPQRPTESRFSRDYRAQEARAPRVAKTARLLGFLQDACEVALMLAFFYAIWVIFAVLS